jgi:putative transcriptional regulator
MRPLVALALAALAAGASAQERVRPTRGALLVARDEIQGGPFHESVVLLLDHGDDGTLGLIINRTTRMPLSEVLPGLEARDPPRKLYFGGPVGLEGLLVLFRSKTPPEGVETVMDDIHYSGDRDVLEGLLAGEQQSDELRLFIGHSGWGAGQLDGELLRGSWDVVRADQGSVFPSDPDNLWRSLSMSERLFARSSWRALGQQRHLDGVEDAGLGAHVYEIEGPPVAAADVDEVVAGDEESRGRGNALSQEDSSGRGEFLRHGRHAGVGDAPHPGVGGEVEVR